MESGAITDEQISLSSQEENEAKNFKITSHRDDLDS